MKHLEWEACYNVRDLGGYPTRDGGQLREGVLIRSDNLYRLTPAGQAALVDYGVRTIIDLRFRDELTTRPSPFANGRATDFGVRYLNISLTPDPREGFDDAFAATESNREGYCLALDLLGPTFARIISAIADGTNQGGVLFHCHAGRDRTGMVAALVLDLCKVPEDIIAEDYAITDTFIREMNEAYIKEISNPKERERFFHELTITRETMRGFLEHLNSKHGRAEAYLIGKGVPREKLEGLRERLVGR